MVLFIIIVRIIVDSEHRRICQGFNPPDASSSPRKVQTPQVECQYHEIKVIEGVSEHTNSLFSTKKFWASPQTNA